MLLQAKLDSLLTGALKSASTDLETLSNGHVSGHVISGEFDGLDYEERSQRIGQIVDQAVKDNRLSHEEAMSISTLLTYTPAEWSVAVDDQ